MTKENSQNVFTNSRITVTLYAVTNPINTTDPQSKINQAKTYLSRDQILAALQDEDGNPSIKLTNNSELEVGHRVMKLNGKLREICMARAFTRTMQA